MEGIILNVEKLNKSFGITHANRNVNFQLRRGEIRGLIGENGSGKSTLVSQICGIQQPTSGTMALNGKPYAPKGPLEANQQGVAMVVQELGVLGTLPGSVNMFIGRMERFTKFGVLDLNAMEKEAYALLDKWGLGEIPLDMMAESLSIEQRKLLELAKALSVEPEILVLDEISQALSFDKRLVLYRIMKEFTAAGHSIIMISHDLEETVELCDSITVLRDGEAIQTIQRDAFDLNGLKRLMIGREVDSQYYHFDPVETFDDQVVLSAEHLTVHGKLEDVSFELHRGEILGVCGLSDAGIHDLGKALFGKEHIASGTVTVNNAKGMHRVTKPGHITSNGGAYLSKDRDADGLMLYATIAKNIQIPSAHDMASFLWFISPIKASALVDDAVERFEIKCNDPSEAVNSLSGGNKQKVNLSRWMIKNLDFIILDCPTRGVDIGVKAYIYNLLYEAKKKGISILLISDELPEVTGMSDRLVIMKDGRVSKIQARSEGFSNDDIMEAMI